MKRTGLYWVKVEMLLAFGRLPPSATVTCPGPPARPRRTVYVAAAGSSTGAVGLFWIVLLERIKGQVHGMIGIVIR